MYNNGEGVAKDVKEAVMWWRKAVEQGNAHAQFYLSMMYDRGEGVTKDVAAAHMWANLAAANGHEGAAKRRDDLEKLMTPGQIEEGQRMTREWLAERERVKAQPVPARP